MRRLGALLLALLFSGCAVGPDYVRPEGPKVEHYTRGAEPTETRAAGGAAQRFDSGFEVPQDWWKLFNAPKLEPLMKKALEANPTLESALATLRESQASLNAGYGVFYPQLDAGFSAAREKSNPRSFGVPVPSSIFSIFTLSGTLTYALDIFGGARRALEGLKAQVESQRYSVSAAYLSLTANLVNTVIARAAYEAEAQATREQLKLLKEQLEITQAQVRAHTVPYANLLSVQSQLSATEAQLSPLAQKQAQAEHLLAALSGQTPAEAEPVEVRLDELTLPERLPRQLPSRLARSRPDILMSEALVHAANAQIGVATARLYPNLTLSATYGVNSVSATNLLEGKNTFWNLGADFTAPLFHGGSLRSERQAAVEAHQAALANYRQTVLNAFAQVADTLRALEHDAEALDAQTQALAAADEARKLIHANYRAGIATYLQVLTVNGQYYQARVGQVQAQAQRLQDTVALFTALGGGW